MVKTRSRKRRVLRLAVTAFVLITVLMFSLVRLPGFAARRGQASAEFRSLRFQHGKLSDLPPSKAPSRWDPHLSRTTALLTGLGVMVRCSSSAEWAQDDQKLDPWRGYTSYAPFLSVHFSPEVCNELARLEREPAPVWNAWRVDALAWSVGALAHESVHAAGYYDEAHASCYGMQRIPQAAKLLGRTAREGRYLAAVYWSHWYAWFRKTNWSRECRDGGRLDLHPGTAVWP